MHTYNHTKGRAQAHTARGTGSYYFCVISLASGMHGGIGSFPMQRASKRCVVRLSNKVAQTRR